VPAAAVARAAALRQEIAGHDHRYYALDAPTVSDAEYDALFRELGDLEGRYPALVTPDSPTQRVAGAAAAAFAPYLGTLAVIGIVYGALVAMVQPDMKKLVAYSSVSHLGFVVLGIAAMNMQGVQGAVYQMLSHGISTGGLFLVVGMLSDRRHTRLIAEYGGLKKVTPHLVAVFLIITLASIGLPGLNGFVGEFLILLGVFKWNPRMAAFAATGVILSATYMLWMFQRVNYGPITSEKNERLVDLRPREWLVILPIVALAILMGVLPNLFLRPIEPSVERMLNHYHQDAAERVRADGSRQPTAMPSVINHEPSAMSHQP